MSNVTELVVNGIDQGQKDNGVDLDGQCLLTRPEGIQGWPEDKRMQWLRDQGYDLSIDFSGTKMWVHGVYTNLAAVSNDCWEAPDQNWVNERLLPGDGSNSLVLWELPQDVQLPLTFTFRTANGTGGLFRITEYHLEEKKATIQIKLSV